MPIASDVRRSHTELACRACGGSELSTFLDLGRTPLADGLVKPEELATPDPVFPLEVAFCHACKLVQIRETVDPELLFQDDYPYYSSFSPALLEHSRRNVAGILERKALGADSLVVELASNDGYLLRNYVAAGVPVLGIDPAVGPATKAMELGVPTRNAFFTEALAEELVAEGVRADVVHANNVLAHVADTNGFVRGIARILDDDGLVVLEAPYLGDLVEHCEFDTIYHEHLCYFSATALRHLFERNGLFFNDVERLAIHGGSLRMYVGKRNKPSPRLLELLSRERERGMGRPGFYRDFGERVREIRDELVRVLDDARARGATVAAYGAAAKGSTLLNFCGIGTERIDFVVDRNVHKHGKAMPGVHIPIGPPEWLVERQPDYTLLLTWNFRDEILGQQAEYRERGGKFVVPIPYPEIV